MLCEDEFIAIYCFVDDLLKEVGHCEDTRRKISDREIITTAIVSALYFGGTLLQWQTLYEDDRFVSIDVRQEQVQQTAAWIR